MTKINLRDVPEIEQRSPTGKFHSFSRNVSLALGGIRNTGPWGGGHPFDFQIRRVPPGAAVCPFHLHLAQWELFVVHAGTGTVRAGRRRHKVGPGEAFMHPPGEAHQLINTGTGDLEVFIIADNPPLDAFHYPDSDKWGLCPPGKFFRLAETDYLDGEDDAPPPPGTPRYQPAGAPLAPALAPFARRRTNLGKLKWTRWKSPKRRFEQSGKDVSGAIGDVLRGWPRKGHPFNLELVKVPPGKAACPFHSHTTQWELFVVLRGTGTVRAGRKRYPVAPGDALMHPPGEAHQIINTGQADLVFYIIADNPAVDIFHYPDSGKWGMRPQGKFFRMLETPYYEGEE